MNTTTADRADRAGRGVVAHATLAAALMFGVFHMPTAPKPASTVEECVKKRVDNGESRPVAVAACVRNTTSTTVPGGGGVLPNTKSSEDDGSNLGVLVIFGLVGALVGAGLTVAWYKRAAASASGSPAVPAAPAMAPPGMPLPAAAPVAPTADDRSRGLVASMIDLADRVPSQALRAEILASLGRAGVHPIEPATGDMFEANRMRGVGSMPTTDPAWVGRVANTERAGFHDGVTVLRLPEVVVYTSGS